jgi:hypothetical protein
MTPNDEMAQAAGAASPADALARSDAVERLVQLARLIDQDETLAAIVRDGQSELRLASQQSSAAHLAGAASD